MDKKQHIIIFEGPDGVGKSTIALKLSKEVEIPYFKNPIEILALKWSDLEMKYRLPDQIYIASFLKQTGYSVIFDRAFPSEFCYSAVYKRDTDLDLLKEIDRKFAELKTIIIICCKSNITNFQDKLVRFEELALLETKYKEFAFWSECTCIFLDTTDENLEKQIEGILEYLGK